MDINATLLGQLIVFSLLVLFIMVYVWPLITNALHEREKKIAAGLEAAERGQRELAAAEQNALSILRDAKQQASQIIEQANVQSVQIIDTAKSQAKSESERLIQIAQNEIDREIARAKEALRHQVANLAIRGAEKVIKRNLDPTTQHDLLADLAAEI